MFGMPETRLALIPAAGGTQILPRIVGEGRAMELLLADERFDSTAALRMGLVGEVAPRGQSLQRAVGRMTALLEAPAAALWAATRSVEVGADMPLGQGLAMAWPARLICFLIWRIFLTTGYGLKYFDKYF